MLVPISWLREFADFDVTAEVLADKMTAAGLEVASIKRIGDFWDRDTVLVGEIASVAPHPNADRLTVPTIAYGGGRSITLVTGAPNIKVGMSGQKVPLALVGSRLIDGHKGDGSFIVLKETKLRGVPSAGMICSEFELGLSEDHGGILILPPDAPLGAPLVDFMGDTVLEIEPTPNLSRCLSIVGVAREAAALTGRRIKLPAWREPEGRERARDLFAIRIDDSSLCARYCGTLISDVTIGPSPFWMRRRLAAAGQRPINNLVDVTNYVMLELGQPLHAFDYDALLERAGGKMPVIIVRGAAEGERIVTLDGVERTAAADTLFIADEKGPIAVAGIMGGRDTEVRAETRRILLESACFHHASIRRSAQRFKLPSQASLRFGKGIPASLAGQAARRATALMADLGGGRAASGVVDAYPAKQPVVTVAMDHGDFARHLGYHIPERRVVEILESLEFQVSEREGALIVTVPDHRLDVSIPADLVEEVARLEGYDKIPAGGLADALPPQESNPDMELEGEMKGLLTAAGLEEIISYSLVDEKKQRAWMDMAYPEARGDFPRLLNPLSEDRTVLRAGLLPGMFEALRSNARFQERVAVFEIGRVFSRCDQGRPDEPRRLGVLLWGLRERGWWGKAEPESMDFFDLKGVILGLIERLASEKVSLAPSSRPCLREGRGVELALGGSAIGFLGELAEDARRGFDLGDGRVMAAELDLEPILAAPRKIHFAAPPRFPAVSQDLALIVDESVTCDELIAEIAKAGGKLLATVVPFDVYRGPQVPPGKKSLAFSLSFQDPERTLTEEEAGRRRQAIVAAAQARFGAVLRGQ